jgi:hypothetical protein
LVTFANDPYGLSTDYA